MLRIRSPQGVHTFRMQTEPPSTLADLQSYIASVTQIPIEHQNIKLGVPPRKLAQGAVNSADVLQKAPLNLQAGDSVTVEVSSAPVPQPRSSPQVPYGNGSVLRLHTIPDDNSCLFHALSYVQTQHTSDTQSQSMRELAVRLLRAAPTEYSDAMLGWVERCSCREPREAYMHKLLQPKTWGGGVELALFAAHFRAEIWCWDVKHGVCHRFGEDGAYPTLWILSYAGIHYDVIEQERQSDTGPEHVTAFDRSATAELRAACERLVRELQQQH
ncbi:OTU1 [Malassezia furfur]|nr:OTU1 [Malassezia furfur]